MKPRSAETVLILRFIFGHIKFTDGGVIRHCHSSPFWYRDRCIFDPLVTPRKHRRRGLPHQPWRPSARLVSPAMSFEFCLFTLFCTRENFFQRLCSSFFVMSLRFSTLIFCCWAFSETRVPTYPMLGWNVQQGILVLRQSLYVLKLPVNGDFPEYWNSFALCPFKGISSSF